MKKLILTVAASLIATGTAYAGDVDAGATIFKKKCKSCHAIIDDDGNDVVKGGKTGPNLYGVIGRTAGTYEGFRYGDGLSAAAEAEFVWTEDEVAVYVADPKAWMEAHGYPKKTKMTFKLREGGEDVAAYLASLTAE